MSTDILVIKADFVAVVFRRPKFWKAYPKKRNNPHIIPPIISCLLIVRMFLFTISRIRIVASPNRIVANENGGASFKAFLTKTKVSPQIMATKSNPI